MLAGMQLMQFRISERAASDADIAYEQRKFFLYLMPSVTLLIAGGWWLG
ncbi:MAG: hypothetical protein ACK4N1_04800 [Pseudorhizobium sp.]